MIFTRHGNDVVVVQGIDLNLVDCSAATCRSLDLMPGKLGPASRLDTGVRNSEVGFFPKGHWLEGIMWHFAAVANSALWKKNIVGVSPIQFARYGTGQMYDWHQDASLPNSTGTQRTLTVVFNISPMRHRGGDLVLRLRDQQTHQTADYVVDALRTPGTAAVFPSATPHKVTPVERGLRTTLVGWVLSASG